MELDKKALGLACGLLWGCGLALVTLLVLIRGGGEHLALLARFYPGYSVSGLGVVLGLVYGFVEGFVGGWLVAWLYNRFAGAKATS